MRGTWQGERRLRAEPVRAHDVLCEPPQQSACDPLSGRFLREQKVVEARAGLVLTVRVSLQGADYYRAPLACAGPARHGERAACAHTRTCRDGTHSTGTWAVTVVIATSVAVVVSSFAVFVASVIVPVAVVAGLSVAKASILTVNPHHPHPRICHDWPWRCR